MSLIHLEVGTMLLLSEFNKNKMVEEEYKSPLKFIIKTEIKAMKKENILDFLIINKNMMHFLRKLLLIVLLQNSFHINRRNLLLMLLMILMILNVQK
jgi:hypothetical protein